MGKRIVRPPEELTAREEALREALREGRYRPPVLAYFTREERRLLIALLRSGTGFLTSAELAAVGGWPEDMLALGARSKASHFTNIRAKGVRIRAHRGHGWAFVFADVWAAAPMVRKGRGKGPRLGRTGRKASEDFALMLQAFRREHHLTVERLGLILGYSRSWASKLANGECEPCPRTRSAVARALREYSAGRR